MRIKVLGCSGAESPGMNSPAFLLDDEFLFDAGTLASVLGERQQMKIRSIFVTHAHLDHIRGIPFLADNIVMARKRRRVTVYSIPSVVTTIRKHLFNSAVWPDFTVIPHPDDAILKLVKVKEGRAVREGEYRVTPYRVDHTVPSVGYLVEDGKGRRLFYTGDTGPTNGTWEKIGKRKIHCLIIDVSFPNSMEELAITTGHLTPRLLRAELAKMILPPGRVLITHPKPHHRKTIEAEIRKMGTDGMRLLVDGETIRV
ncbi:MAG: beta-lactamase domain protein [Deltaproteobacteria bacterium]|nr:beta-lactamase domain protein [Deltaproteobacteria bacterium]